MSVQIAMAQKQKHIGFLMDDFYSIRWVQDSAIFGNKVRELGHKVSIKVCDSDTGLQHQQVKDLIKEGADVLVIVAEDCNTAGRLVETAHKSKIPVIAYDRLIMNADVDYYVSFDAQKVGEMQAKFLLDTLKGKGNIMLINGPKTDQNAIDFREGQLKALKPAVASGKIKVLYDRQISEWTLLEAMMEGNEFLSTYKGTIDGVIAANDELAEGILQAYGFLNPGTSLLITGQDANPPAVERIKVGTQAMTVYKPIENLASEAAILACNVALGKKIQTKRTINNGKKNVPFVELDPILVTKKNITRYFK